MVVTERPNEAMHRTTATDAFRHSFALFVLVSDRSRGKGRSLHFLHFMLSLWSRCRTETLDLTGLSVAMARTHSAPASQHGRSAASDTMQIWRAAIALTIAATLLPACATRPQEPLRTEGTPARLRRPAAVYMLGFFNNENAQRFEPSPIDYSPMVDFAQFYSSLGGRLAEAGLELIPLDQLDLERVPDESSVQQIHRSLYKTLVVLRAFLLGLPGPADFDGAPMPGLVSFKQEPPDWAKRGGAYAVIGLETTVGHTGSGHVLRSGLAVLRLQPDGTYVDVVFSIYDFTNINADKLSILVSESIAQLHPASRAQTREEESATSHRGPPVAEHRLAADALEGRAPLKHQRSAGGAQ